MERVSSKTSRFFALYVALFAFLVIAVGSIIGVLAEPNPAVLSPKFSPRVMVEKGVALKTSIYLQEEGDLTGVQVGLLEFDGEKDQEEITTIDSIDDSERQGRVRVVFFFENVGEDDVSFTLNWKDFLDYHYGGYEETQALKNVYAQFSYYANYSIEDIYAQEFPEDEDIELLIADYSWEIKSGKKCAISVTFFVADAEDGCMITSEGGQGLQFEFASDERQIGGLPEEEF